MPGHTIDRRLVTEVECGVCGLRQGVARGCVRCQAGVISSQWPTTCDNWTSWDLWHKWHSHDPGSSLGMGVRLCLAPPTSAPCASCTMTQTRDSSTVRGAGYAGGMSKILFVFFGNKTYGTTILRCTLVMFKVKSWVVVAYWMIGWYCQLPGFQVLSPGSWLTKNCIFVLIC